MIISSATSDMMGHLSKSILNSDDLSMVKDGAPAYLLMIDSLIHRDPENKNLLRTASALYTSYADLFVKDRVRSKKMADKALDYAQRAICLENHDACRLKSITFKEFETIISNMQKEDVPAFFTLGNAWAGWIMVNTNDFNAIADISRIELIMQRIIELDETYQDGAAYLYLGTLASLLPPSLGGKPQQGKLFFNKAMEICKGKNLMVKVLFAKMYARMMFDRTLHDKLLKEVITADPNVPGFTLVNTWAQVQAMELIKSADDYF
ncbi:MAG: hypothetical protein GY857_09985 [Desulfobacula sp.]|nr:hypothetical protein [Desulfobacula sp.]